MFTYHDIFRGSFSYTYSIGIAAFGNKFINVDMCFSELLAAIE